MLPCPSSVRSQSMQANNWLISSGGRRGALVDLFRESTSPVRSRVVVTDVSRLSAAGQHADEFELVPRISADNFLSETLRISKKHGCSTIVPTIDPEIAVLARARAQFRQHGVDIWVSSPQVAELGWDKWDLYRWLIEAGYPTIDTQEIAESRLVPFAGRVVAKPRTGSSSIGVLIVDNVESLRVSALTDDYILQRFAPGIEVTVDVAVDERGTVLATVPRRRLEVRAGEVSKGVTIHVPEIELLVRDMVTSLPGAYGVLNVQVIYDPETNSPKILEINPRFGGGYPLSHAAGGDLIGAMLRSKTGDTASETWRPGTVMLRYDEAKFYADQEFVLSPWS
ncbi:ATP-grasp domain-containing protein [Cryobacterium cryoconiti]|uniref:ATP-grasp domain-containing protein n=2 Tax=Cryobacterium cryoconiti TaxID=1259239 RepID=A0A4Y8JX19_9MICO|nr:ATP-grasp domain-containing protein [Cryobacterium cryoconiti]